VSVIKKEKKQLMHSQSLSNEMCIYT